MSLVRCPRLHSTESSIYHYEAMRQAYFPTLQVRVFYFRTALQVKDPGLRGWHIFRLARCGYTLRVTSQACDIRSE